MLEQLGRAVLQGEYRLNSLTLGESKGWIAGGKRNVEASILLGTDEGANEKKRRNAEWQEGILKEYANEADCWINPDAFIELLNEGDEAKVYPSEREGYVVKVYDYKRFSRTPLHFLLYRVSIHNFLFPNTLYQLKGFTTTENFMGQGSFAFVLEQPFVQGRYLTNYERSKVFIPRMEEMGFEYSEENFKPIFSSKGYIIKDLHNKNVLVTYDGNLRFIDTVIERRK